VHFEKRGHEMKEALIRNSNERSESLKWIVCKMCWLEDWGHHELSNERGPLTAPEKHDHQTTTNQVVSQPKETWIGNN